MANTKNNPGNKSTEQRGQETSFGNGPGRPNPSDRSGERTTTDAPRKAGLAEDAQMSGIRANTTGSSQAGRTPDARGAKTQGTDRDENRDRDSKGQNPSNTREIDGLDDEDDAGTLNLPASDELDGVTGDAETDIDEDTDADTDLEDDRRKMDTGT